MKRALETVNFVRSAKVVFLALGLVFGITLLIVGLTHTVTVGLFQKEPQVLWGLVLLGSLVTGVTPLVYVVLSCLEQMLLALVIIATDPSSKPNLVLNTASGYRWNTTAQAEQALKHLHDTRTADERFAADADQAIRIGNAGRGGSATIHGSGTTIGGKGGDA